MLIRELTIGEVHLYKSLRLRALKDASDAFGETYDDAVNKSEEFWEVYFTSMLPPNIQRMFVAEMDDEIVGSVYAFLDKADSRVGRIGGMWVDSKARKLGVGKSLVEKVEHWAIENKLIKLRFWVFDQAGGALPFYLKMGYSKSGVLDTNHDGRTLIEMEKVIGD